jgi:hypothetical protein
MKPIQVDLSDHNRIVLEFKNESDRGAAVLAGSLLENYLAKYLKHHMVDDPEIDKMFDGFGAFSDLGKRIECAYAFRFISQKEKRVLDFIKKIRNHFAHNPFEAGFNKEPVSNWCKSFLISDLLPKTGGDPRDDKSKDWDNRLKFLISISIFISKWEIEMGYDISTIA